MLGDTTREATSTEVQDLRRENNRLKQVVAETVLENRVLKKNLVAAYTVATRFLVVKVILNFLVGLLNPREIPRND